MASQKDIPNGCYCYTIVDIKPTKNAVHINRKLCPFFRVLPPEKDGYRPAYCAYVKDKEPILLDDLCKICDENMGDEDGVF